MLHIRKVDPRNTEISALLGQSHALMQSMFDAEDCHFLDVDALCIPEVHLFAAYRDDIAVATGAIKTYADYAEVKSMFTDPAQRGKGTAQALLSHLIQATKSMGLPALKLETGVGLDAAHALYHKNGFIECGPFGEYQAADASIFMTLELST